MENIEWRMTHTSVKNCANCLIWSKNQERLHLNMTCHVKIDNWSYLQNSQARQVAKRIRDFPEKSVVMKAPARITGNIFMRGEWLASTVITQDQESHWGTHRLWEWITYNRSKYFKPASLEETFPVRFANGRFLIPTKKRNSFQR